MKTLIKNNKNILFLALSALLGSGVSGGGLGLNDVDLTFPIVLPVLKNVDESIDILENNLIKHMKTADSRLWEYGASLKSLKLEEFSKNVRNISGLPEGINEIIDEVEAIVAKKELLEGLNPVMTEAGLPTLRQKMKDADQNFDSCSAMARIPSHARHTTNLFLSTFSAANEPTEESNIFSIIPKFLRKNKNEEISNSAKKAIKPTQMNLPQKTLDAAAVVGFTSATLKNGEKNLEYCKKLQVQIFDQTGKLLSKVTNYRSVLGREIIILERDVEQKKAEAEAKVKAERLAALSCLSMFDGGIRPPTGQPKVPGGGDDMFPTGSSSSSDYPDVKPHLTS